MGPMKYPMSWLRLSSTISFFAVFAGILFSTSGQAGYWQDYFHKNEEGRASLEAEMKGLRARNEYFDYLTIEAGAEVRLHLAALATIAEALPKKNLLKKNRKAEDIPPQGVFLLDDDAQTEDSDEDELGKDLSRDLPSDPTANPILSEQEVTNFLLEAKSRCKRIKKIMISNENPDFWRWAFFKVRGYDETLSKIGLAVGDFEVRLFISQSGFDHLKERIRSTLDGKTYHDFKSPSFRPISPALHAVSPDSGKNEMRNFSDPTSSRHFPAISEPVAIDTEKARKHLTRSLGSSKTGIEKRPKKTSPFSDIIK